MSLLNHAKQTRRVLTNAFRNNYARRMPYSASVDRLNRQPLLENFKQRHADVPGVRHPRGNVVLHRGSLRGRRRLS